MKIPSLNNIVVRCPESHILEAPDSVFFGRGRLSYMSVHFFSTPKINVSVMSVNIVRLKYFIIQQMHKYIIRRYN